jgi:hypothetical protein
MRVLYTLLLLAITAALQAQDVTGTWEGELF